MLCQRCNERDATIHLYTSVNGKKQEVNLCQRCYQELNNKKTGDNMNYNSSNDPFGFGNFDDLFRQMNRQRNPYSQGNPRQQNPFQGGGGQQPPQGGSGGPSGGGVLDQFGVNMNDLAKEGKIDPVIGRDQEIERIIEILNRRQKNNPVLIGEAGVGKTAVVEGLAHKIVEGEVPAKLQGKEIISLDVASLVQGTGIRGQFEERVQQLVKELEENQNLILFIDEIHEIVGAGTAEGSNMDAGNILKPALARGDIQLIGATTLNEYRQIEKDAALERRLQPVRVEEPNVQDTIKIMEGIKPYYEDYHHVTYTDEALEDAVTLSDRYIQDRQLPDKAIDLIDEAGSKKNLTIRTMDPNTIKESINYAEELKQKATEEENFEDAAFYRDQVAKYQDMLKNQSSEQETPQVTSDDIVRILERQTGIPIGDLQEQESEQLRNLDEEIKEEVIGQDEAIDQIVRAIQRSRVGLKRPNRPTGSFLFVGPTGVGKTETAKVLADKLFGSRDAYIRLDMSEYMEKHSTSKLIGSPPGYVGYDEAGQLTEQVRRNPYSLILVDEIEKAHPDVLNVFLQIMDDGRLTDSQGRTVNFEDTIIIMTSNAGTGDAEANVGFGAQQEGRQGTVIDQLTNYFRPEFLNRFTAIVEFDPLSKEDLLEIVDLMIGDVNQLLEKQDVHIEVRDDAKEKLVDLGYDPNLGARPLRRVIEEQIEDKIAEYFLNHTNVDNMVAIVNEDDEIVIGEEQDTDKDEDVNRDDEN